jgi:hypothetical protein
MQRPALLITTPFRRQRELKESALDPDESPLHYHKRRPGDLPGLFAVLYVLLIIFVVGS